MLEICKKCIVGMTCTKICDKFYEAIKNEPITESILDFINDHLDTEVSDKMLQIFIDAKKCLVCGHDKVVHVDFGGRDVVMIGYCENCQTLYSKQDEDNDLFYMALKDDHSFHEYREEELAELEEDEDDDVMTFENAIKVWKAIGAI